MIDAVILMLVLLVAFGAGRRCLRAVPFESGIEEALFAIGLGLALFAYATLGLGEIGLLRWQALAAVLALGAWFGRRELGAGLARAARGGRRWATRPHPGEIVALALGAALLALECVLVLAPAVGGDQTKYQLVYPRLYAEAGRFVATPWSFWGYVQYLVNMLFAAAFVLRGDVLARLVNVAYGVLATLAVLTLGRRCFGRAVGVWAALLFFTMPFTATLMIRAWVELALTFYVLLAVLAVLAWRETGARTWLALGAVMGGLAAATKVMGVLAPSLLGVLVFVTATGRGGLRAGLRATVGFGLVAMIVASPCYLRNAVETGNPIYPFGYGLFGGSNWSAQAAQGLDAYYAAYREIQAHKRGAGAYGSWLATLRFPWDATMSPHAFEDVGRFAYDVGPLLLAFAPGVLLLRREPRAWILLGLALAYGATVVLGMWPHPRYVHPTLPLLLLVAVQVVWTLGAAGARARQATIALLALTVAGQTATALRVVAPMLPDSARVAAGRMSEDAFLRRYERRYPLWDLVNREVPATGNVVILAMIPHPYHITRRFTLASPLEQGAIDYRQLASVDDLTAALVHFGVTHVVREPEEEKAAANPIGERVTQLWGELIARSEKVAETSSGALYRLGPALAGEQHETVRPASGT